MVNNLNELVELLARRDSISLLEANNLIDIAAEEIRIAIEEGKPLEMLEDIVADLLGLEPDYLFLLINEMF